jgi:hypothetical protein
MRPATSLGPWHRSANADGRSEPLIPRHAVSYRAWCTSHDSRAAAISRSPSSVSSSRSATRRSAASASRAAQRRAMRSAFRATAADRQSVCPDFVARDLSGFRTARKGGGGWAGQDCCKGYDKCVSKDCSSGMSGVSYRRRRRQRCWGSRSGRSGAGATGCAMRSRRGCSIGGSANHRAAVRRPRRSCACWGSMGSAMRASR